MFSITDDSVIEQAVVALKCELCHAPVMDETIFYKLRFKLGRFFTRERQAFENAEVLAAPTFRYIYFIIF
jgi:hypothetical protein